LKLRDRILNNKFKTGQNGVWRRSCDASRFRDLLNIQATDALRNGKIRESIAFDFQYGYRMWTWFVNYLDKKSKKINFKN